jgi:phosphopantothenoylcysteine synthetase/decarboxylase
MKVLITSGGTKVPIDDVRFIGNMSSGRYGAALADAFASLGADVDFFYSGKQPTSFNIYQIEYKDYFDYLNVKALIAHGNYDVIISAAAVSDYIVDKREGKMSSDGEQTITLKPAEKVLSSFRKLAPNALIVGFKLLVSPTPDERRAAIDKVLNRGVDMVVYNDLTELRKGNTTRFLFEKVHPSKIWMLQSPEETARFIYGTK